LQSGQFVLRAPAHRLGPAAEHDLGVLRRIDEDRRGHRAHAIELVAHVRADVDLQLLGADGALGEVIDGHGRCAPRRIRKDGGRGPERRLRRRPAAHPELRHFAIEDHFGR
jgi:hypothetical protein